MNGPNHNACKAPPEESHDPLEKWPRACPRCGTSLNWRLGQSVGPCFPGRLLKRLAVLTVPLTFVLTMIWLASGRGPKGFGTGLGWFLMGVTLAPAGLLYGIASLLPRRRRFRCFRCDRQRVSKLSPI